MKAPAFLIALAALAIGLSPSLAGFGFHGSVGTPKPPVVISNISSGTPAQTSVTITATLTPAAFGQVCYGLTTSYGTCITRDASSNTAYVGIITGGLTANTLYHYQVNATNPPNYSQGFSTDQTFTTATPPAGCAYAATAVADGCSVATGIYQNSTFFTTAPQSGQSYLSTTFTGAISGGVLTVSGATGSPVVLNDTVYSTNTPAGVYVSSFGTGTGGNGTYNLANAAGVSVSETMQTMHRPNWNVACVDYPCGPTQLINTLADISTYPGATLQAAGSFTNNAASVPLGAGNCPAGLAAGWQAYDTSFNLGINVWLGTIAACNNTTGALTFSTNGGKTSHASSASADFLVLGQYGCAFIPAGSGNNLNKEWNQSYPMFWCGGNQGTNYTISGYNFSANGSHECANLAIFSASPSTETVEITNNAWVNGAGCGTCLWGAVVCTPVVGSTSGTILTGFIMLGALNYLNVHNNYFDGQWDQACCTKVYGGGDIISSTSRKQGLQFEYNYAKHLIRNPLNLSFVSSGRAADPACSNGTSLSNPGFNDINKFNYIEGWGFRPGAFHGEWANHNVTTVNTAFSGSIAGSTLTASINTLNIGAILTDATNSLISGTLITAGPSGAGPYTYTVTRTQTVGSGTSDAMTAHYGNLCQLDYEYNTAWFPSAGASVTAGIFYSFNNSGAIAETFTVSNNTEIYNLAGAASITVPGGYNTQFTWDWNTTNANQLTILGSPSLGPFRGSAINSGGSNLALGDSLGTDGSGNQVWEAACNAASGTWCPGNGEWFDACPVGPAINGSGVNQCTGNPQTSGTNTAFQASLGGGFANAQHGLLGTTTWTNNYIDVTGGNGGWYNNNSGGTSTLPVNTPPSGSSPWLFGGDSGQTAVSCQNPITVSGNIDLVTGTSAIPYSPGVTANSKAGSATGC